MSAEEKLYTIQEIADIFGIHRTSIDNYIKHGILVPDVTKDSMAFGSIRVRLFKQETVDAFVKSCIVTDYDGDEPLLTTEDAARMLWTTNSTIHNYVVRGLLKPDVVLPALGKRGGKRLFKLSTVQTLLEDKLTRRGHRKRKWLA